MNIISEEIYHIYNQGNNQETLFLKNENYLQFLVLFRKFVSPYCKVLAYCLMPNHFHFLIHATNESEKAIRIGNIDLCELSNGFRLLQSSYTTYFNKQYERSGSLFRQKAKSKSMADGDKHYGFTAFQYIHQNPLKAGIVSRMEDWLYSSYTDYMQLRNGTLCDRELAFQLIGFDRENFAKESYQAIDENLIPKIF